MEKIRTELKKVILDIFGVEVEPMVTEAPEDTGADFASNVAFILAKELHKAPREIAQAISDKLENAEVAGGGFLNFISPDEYFVDVVDKFATSEEEIKRNISSDEYKGKKVVCEFSDPNPFKVLHVGHLYTSVVGDAIARLIENAGGDVVRANFGGDVGLHVAKTIYALTVKDEQSLDSLSIEDIAKAYVEGTRAYEEDEEAKKKITALNKEIYNINKNDIHEGEVAEIYWKGRELSYQYFEDFYDSIGVKFDKYYPESTVAEKGLLTIKEHTPEVYEESDGALVFRGEKYGLHTRVFVNKEGIPTYEAKDVGLLFTKNEDYHFDESVVITGNDIIDYMKVVLKSVEQFAPELVKKTTHITHGNVRLPGNEKMSSRKGNFIKAVDILDAVENELPKKDNLLTLAAIKYGFLRYRVGGNIEFDVKECVSTTGNSGIYLLYSAVRAKKILEKCGKEQGNVGEKLRASFDYKMGEYERKLCKKMVKLPEVVGEATRNKMPHLICNYLYEMSQEFSRFYENVKVAGSEFEVEREKIVKAYLNVMNFGLNLLGIEVPDEM